MNKNIKGAVAIAAGVVLLMGGAGSLAYWNDTQSVASAAGVNAGTLSATAGTGGWTKGFYDNSGNVITAPASVSPGSTLVVPGNRLVYQQS